MRESDRSAPSVETRGTSGYQRRVAGAAVVQSDRSVIVEVDHPGYEAAREVLARCAEIEKSPEHVHTYRLSDLSLWNAAAQGVTPAELVAGLSRISRFPLPSNVVHEIEAVMARHGVCALHDLRDDPARLRLSVREGVVRDRLEGDKRVGPLLQRCPDGFVIATRHRGMVKQALLKIGYPVDDRASLQPGEPLAVGVRRDLFVPYPYQDAACRAFVDAGSHGVVVLPCGAGKTVVALLAIEAIGARTLVLVANREAGEQWRREILKRTTLGQADVGRYDTGSKRVAPVTVVTYHMLAVKGGGGPTGHRHFDVLAREPWGLIVYDEVHLLPAPVFRLTAEVQARRRLGLTATLVREDGRAGDVFALIGPKRYDVPWRELESSGHIAAATCYELRVPLDPALLAAYAHAERREQPRVAGENPKKLDALRVLYDRHAGDRMLVIGSYLEPLAAAARLGEAPLVTGDTAHAERERHYEAFRRGEIRRLVLSRVGNFAIDLPDANVLVQLSGTMGSRQEEAQRLGRVLRPKPGGAIFYTLVTRDTVEQELALHRQLFLTEQGYRYFIEDVPDHGEDAGPTLH
jgi:DNA excision repair protein ERCC-3